MSSINQEISKLIDSDISIQKDLDRKIINVRGLAKYILKKYRLKSSLDAVINAIRRYEPSIKFSEEEVESVFKHSKISTKNNVVCITSNLESYKNLSKIFLLTEQDKRDKYRITTGPNNIKIITEKSHISDVISALQTRNIVQIEENLSEINISLIAKAIKTRGVLARIANELSVNSINITEIIINPPDFLIYVKEKDLIKAHETLIKLSE